MNRISAKVKNRFLIVFLVITAVLALVRVVFPSVAKARYSDQVAKQADSLKAELAKRVVSAKKITTVAKHADRQEKSSRAKASLVGLEGTVRFFNADGSPAKHRIIGVVNYDTSFPDMQDVQLLSAKKYGVSPVQDRADAEKRKDQLVFIGFNPYFEVKKLYNSVPYLVPRASILLQDIGRNFMDSLQLKGLPMNKLLVTSVLRTKEDVARLRRFNHNATENSCHLYGTTFDIAYNKYLAVGREVRNDTLKWVLSEVLNDLRKQGRCYVKHERHQGCYHITIR